MLILIIIWCSHSHSCGAIIIPEYIPAKELGLVSNFFQTLVTSILAHFGEKPGFHLKYFTLATCCSVLSFYHFQFWGCPAVSFMLRFGIPQLFSTTVQLLDIPRNVSYILRPSTERSPFLAGFPHFPWLKVPLPGANPSVFSTTHQRHGPLGPLGPRSRSWKRRWNATKARNSTDIIAV